MNSLNLRVGQWLAILTVFVALGRCFYDAYLTSPNSVDGREQIKIGRLERKLAAMQRSEDEVARQKVVADLVRSYIETCQYEKAEPLVLQALSQKSSSQQLSDATANFHARALAECGDYYGHRLNIERAQICYLKAIDIFSKEQNSDAVAKCYLSLARLYQSQAEVMVQGSKQHAAFSAAEKWLGEAVSIARQSPLSESSKNYLRNSYLLLLAAEGRSDDLVSDLATSSSSEPAKDF